MPVRNPYEVAAAARARRRELGLTQAQLGELAHTSREWVNRFERGEPRLEYGLVLDLLQALKVDVTLTPQAPKTRGLLASMMDASDD